MKKETKKDTTGSAVIKKPATDVSVPKGSWGNSGVDKSDVIIPKLLLMQPMSTFVSQGKAKPGDIVNSLTNEVLGNQDDGVSFIPFYHQKEWTRHELIDNLPRFVSKEPWTPANSDKPWEEEIDGHFYRNTACLNFFLYLINDISEKLALPKLVTFRSTSYREGKKLATWFEESEINDIRWSRKIWTLRSKFIQEQNKKYYVFELENTNKDSPPRGEVAAYQWFKQLQKLQFKVDDRDLHDAKDKTVNDEEVPF